jgi:predicted nucleic acid-binding protein
LNGLGLTHDEVVQETSDIERLLALLPEVPAIYLSWKGLVQRHRVQGVKVYDARLVAIMSVYRIETVLTFNVDDFKRYGNISALHPSAVLA